MKKTFKKRLLICLTTAALLLNALLPFYAVYDSRALAAKLTAAAETQSLFSFPDDKILICTSEGFKWVTQDDLQNGGEQPAQHPLIKCPLCYLAVFGVKQSLPSVTASLDRVPSAVDDILHPGGHHLPHASPAQHSYHSRAPPASA